MNIMEARQLLDILEQETPTVDIRMSINVVELMEKIRASKYHVVLESNVWNKTELTIPAKLERIKC